MNYIIHLLIMICLYTVLAQSLNLVVGYGGLLSLCHAACYGFGAYISALFMLDAGWSFGVSLIAAVIVTGLIAWLLSFPAMRLKGDFFVLVTLGFQLIIFAIIYNWDALTRGSVGI